MEACTKVLTIHDGICLVLCVGEFVCSLSLAARMTGLAIGAVFEVAGIGAGVGCGCLAGFGSCAGLVDSVDCVGLVAGCKGVAGLVGIRVAFDATAF